MVQILASWEPPKWSRSNAWRRKKESRAKVSVNNGQYIRLDQQKSQVSSQVAVCSVIFISQTDTTEKGPYGGLLCTV